MRLLLSVILAIVLVIVLTTTVFASWDEKVTGGGLASVGGVEFSITVSAWGDAETLGGQIEYSRSDLCMHATVECMEVFAEGTKAVLAGPVRAQYDPTSYVQEGYWLVVNVLEGGIGAGDQVRVYQVTEAQARAACAIEPSSFPGTIYDGNFNIRLK